MQAVIFDAESQTYEHVDLSEEQLAGIYLSDIVGLHRDGLDVACRHKDGSTVWVGRLTGPIDA